MVGEESKNILDKAYQQKRAKAVGILDVTVKRARSIAAADFNATSILSAKSARSSDPYCVRKL